MFATTAPADEPAVSAPPQGVREGGLVALTPRTDRVERRRMHDVMLPSRPWLHGCSTNFCVRQFVNSAEYTRFSVGHAKPCRPPVSPGRLPTWEKNPSTLPLRS